MLKKLFIKKVPFIGWVKFKEPNNEPYGDLGVYLVNPTSKTYEEVEMFYGMFEGDLDGLLESSKVVKNLGTLKPYSSIKIDAMTWYDLDFVFWYLLDFFPRLKDKPESYSFEIMKAYDWKEEKIEPLPVLNTKGIKIVLSERKGLPISEEVKNAYLESRYTPTRVNE